MHAPVTRKYACGFNWAELDELARDKPWVEQLEIRQILVTQGVINELEQESAHDKPVQSYSDSSPAKFINPKEENPTDLLSPSPETEESSEKENPVENPTNVETKKSKKTKKKSKKPKKKQIKDSDDDFLDQAIKEADIERKRMEQKKKKESEAKESRPSKTNDTSEIIGAAKSEKVQIPVITPEMIYINGNKEQVHETVEHAFKNSERFAKLLASTHEKERMMDMRLNDKVWISLCQAIYLKYKDKIIIEHARHSVEYYQNILMNYLRDVVCSALTNFQDKGVLETYKPDETPICLIFLQKSIGEVFPSLDVALPVEKMIKYNLLPKDISTYKPFGEDKKLWGFALLNSLSMKFSVLMGVFEEAPGKFIYYMLAFNRVTQNMDELLQREDIKFMKDSQEESFVDGEERLIIKRNDMA
ncbi:MAG: hypothetical protein JRZ94_04680 [Nitrososphaerota archaeon]|nr:hypothetical protein [Nitrososphaerota archaeon]